MDLVRYIVATGPKIPFVSLSMNILVTENTIEDVSVPTAKEQNEREGFMSK